MTYRVPYKHANRSLMQFLGVGLGSFPTLPMERLSASERTHDLSIINRRCRVKTGLQHQMPKDKLPDPITLFSQGLGIEWTQSEKKV